MCEISRLLADNGFTQATSIRAAKNYHFTLTPCTSAGLETALHDYLTRHKQRAKISHTPMGLVKLTIIDL